MKVSIVIPVYNEASTIDRLLDRVVQAALPDGCTREILIVDDGSNDGTRERLLVRDRPPYQVLLHERNQGKGAALRTGFAAATGDIVMVQDADLEYDPSDYLALLEPLIAGSADVVYGSRYLAPDLGRTDPIWHRAGNFFLTWFSNLLSGLSLTDMETGYKVFKREILNELILTEDRFGIEPEITAAVARLVRKKGIKLQETAITYTPRGYGSGKKIGFRDGIRAIHCILKFNGLRFTRR